MRKHVDGRKSSRLNYSRLSEVFIISSALQIQNPLVKILPRKKENIPQSLESFDSIARLHKTYFFCSSNKMKPK